ncbi:RNA polymerase sigma factor [Lachnospiraceae bacterium]|nr:RNA polymerase sigma factor [Lachnospiraceae bacterium]
MNRIQLEQCIHEYGTDIYRFCRQITESRQEAEDLYQDTFLKAVELEEQIDFRYNPRSYLISVAIRIWKNRRRKFAWRQRIAETCKFTEKLRDEEIPEQAGSAEAEALKQELQEQVRNAVRNLNEKYRIPVYLYYTLQLSVEEIANTMEIPQGTVKSRLHKARALLKKELEVIWDEI